MRKSVLAVFAAGSVFALTAAGASTLNVLSAPAPAGGSGVVEECGTEVAVAYTVTSGFPSQMSTIDITPTYSANGCATMPALIRITAGTETAFAYRPGGLGASGSTTNLDVYGDLWNSAQNAIDASNPGFLYLDGWTVAGFTSPTVSITMAGSFSNPV